MSQTPPIPPPGTPPGYPPPGYPPPGYPPPGLVPPPPGYPPPGPQQPYPPAFAAFPQVRSPRQWQAHVRTQLEAGMPVGQVLAEMAAAGLPQQAAYGVVADVVGSMRKRALALVIGGIVAVLVGIAVTLGTMQAAREAAESSGSGMYLMWWGPIVFGALAAGYGLYLLSKVPGPNP